MSNSERKLSPGRTSFVSAVLFVVLLAATGLPVEPQRHVAGDRIACCEAQHAAAVTRAEARRELAARPARAAVSVQLPRPPHRARRIDCGGLPPPRAPDDC